MSYLPFVQRAAWIWSAEGSHAAPTVAPASHYPVRYFRRVFSVAKGSGAQLTVHVSADSRFLFYCNGHLVGRGPAKGDVNHHFYDRFDLTPLLRAGRNVVAALVLDMSRVAHRPSALGAPCSVMTYTGGFVLEGELAGDASERIDTGLAGWRVAADRGFRFQNIGTRFEGYHGYFEHRVSAEIPAGWTQPEFDDSAWSEATVLYTAERLENRRDPTSPYGLMPRIIPQLEEGPGARFADVFLPGGALAGEAWSRLVAGSGPVTVPPRTTVRVVLDAGKLTTGYPSLQTAGGAGATLTLTYAEALRLPWSTPGARLLGKPQPLANLASHFADESSGWTFDRRGTVTGWCDVWEPAGAPDEEFEPLHWRAFRYIGLEIKTGDAALQLCALGHRFSAYPYEVKAEFACSDARLEKIWRVGLHTMRLCSHETFEDCPHYEQMQYAGDTMITSKIAMLTTGDYALSRQALLQFDWSRLSEGLTQSRYPSRLVQVIPSWSLHWITNIRDYLFITGDRETAQQLLPGMTAVLDWFRRHGDADGLPAKLPFWNITDWCPWWPRGVVPGADTGPTCIIAAQFIQALDDVADLERSLGRAARAQALADEAHGLRASLHRRFWSEGEGLYLDRPGGPEVSQYGNAWAIVCGAAGERERARVLKRFPSDAALAPGSFFWWHTGFRALERAGAYDRMPEFLGPWHEMVEAGLDTFVEENSYWRSLCHAWSAHPALEFLERVLGVTPRAPGFAEIAVQPHRCGLQHARGRVCTPRGPVTVAWRVEGTRFHLEIDSPAATPVQVTLPDGSRAQGAGGKFHTAVTLS
ncbi:alpha-L-rhamnosidase C-terminal domain-containing protein [Oleiharenicola sp. Vm1]|uniref:alpha-L-rhamnosidase-related protein n=1 Tax=Oleiharenicola sp. Vm1 TaxID=3398393 RepID=UPI0039F532A5